MLANQFTHSMFYTIFMLSEKLTKGENVGHDHIHTYSFIYLQFNDLYGVFNA